MGEDLLLGFFRVSGVHESHPGSERAPQVYLFKFGTRSRGAGPHSGFYVTARGISPGPQEYDKKEINRTKGLFSRPSVQCQTFMK